jgi:hypothetical protein
MDARGGYRVRVGGGDVTSGRQFETDDGKKTALYECGIDGNFWQCNDFTALRACRRRSPLKFF